MRRLEVVLLLLDGMLVHRRSLPRDFVRFLQQIAGTHLYPWVERGTVRVKYLALELAAESSPLTMRPLRLPQVKVYTFRILHLLTPIYCKF